MRFFVRAVHAVVTYFPDLFPEPYTAAVCGMQLDIKPEVLAEVKVEQSEAHSEKSHHRKPSEKDRHDRHKDENRQKGRLVLEAFGVTSRVRIRFSCFSHSSTRC